MRWPRARVQRLRCAARNVGKGPSTFLTETKLHTITESPSGAVCNIALVSWYRLCGQPYFWRIPLSWLKSGLRPGWPVIERKETSPRMKGDREPGNGDHPAWTIEANRGGAVSALWLPGSAVTHRSKGAIQTTKKGQCSRSKHWHVSFNNLRNSVF